VKCPACGKRAPKKIIIMRIKSHQPTSGSGYSFTPQQTFRRAEEVQSVGALLEQGGFLTAQQTAQVLAAQKQNYASFGETAVRLGYIDQSTLDTVLAQQFGLPTQRRSGSTLHPSLTIAQGAKDPTSEHMRSIRAKLSLQDQPDVAAGEPLAFAICSADRGAGRSFFAASLAIAFAQSGVRTLLIDADLRQPSQHRLFGIENRVGLSSYLGGRQTEAPLFEVADMDGLAIIPAGPIAPNPKELLSRPGLANLCAGRDWDAGCVILDSPSLQVADDAALIAMACGNAVALVRRHHTSIEQAEILKRALPERYVRLLGLVLNRT
jgi:protein-tyrosine kinase